MHHTCTLLEDPKADKSIFEIQKYPEVYKTSMKIHLIPGYPDTSESLKSRIAIIARIPGYIYPAISPGTIHQPVSFIFMDFMHLGTQPVAALRLELHPILQALEARGSDPGALEDHPCHYWNLCP